MKLFWKQLGSKIPYSETLFTLLVSTSFSHLYPSLSLSLSVSLISLSLFSSLSLLSLSLSLSSSCSLSLSLLLSSLSLSLSSLCLSLPLSSLSSLSSLSLSLILWCQQNLGQWNLIWCRDSFFFLFALCLWERDSKLLFWVSASVPASVPRHVVPHCLMRG